MMFRALKHYAILLALLLLPTAGYCTAIKVTNPSYWFPSITEAQINFDVTWNRSWRTSSVVSNWDAAWIFAKFRKSGGNWTHCHLKNTGTSTGSGAAAATITTGLVDTSSAYNSTSNPIVGAFLYRSGNGSGTFSRTGVGLPWDYSTDGVAYNEVVEIRVFAIEMVYIPQGAFFAGDNATSTYAFRQGSSDNDPWYIGSESAMSVTGGTGTGTGAGETNAEYYYTTTGQSGESTTGSSFSIPAAFPKGYQPFYMMKGEISQGQWVAFFNTLTSTQKSNLDITSSSFGSKASDSLTTRNNVSWSSGDATLPDQGGGANYEATAMGYLGYNDIMSYLDWAGLRPMSELEFEKAARGTYGAVSGEYPWGTTSATSATSVSDAGLTTERPQTGANAVYSSGVSGPLRVGSCSYNVTTRIASGSGYYGNMDLGGNVRDAAVCVGMSAGRSFEGRYHGDGALTTNGNHDVTSWPPYTSASGYGSRGDCFYGAASYVRTSDRSTACYPDGNRNSGAGGRGVRIAP